MDLSTVVRPNILALAPYSCARDEFKGEASIFVDANESPYNNGVNRYPDPLQLVLKQRLSEIKGVAVDHIFLGNGSDEAIDLIYRIFCQPRLDNVVAISPSYGMYKVCADINDVQYRAVALKTGDKQGKGAFSIDRVAMTSCVSANTKVLWFCSPNNPTGNAFEREELEWFLQQYPQKIIVVDEAYIDFSDKGSMTEYLDRYDNLIVMQTMSKAWGQAAIRLGIAFASPQIIALFNKVKYPYNVNLLTQQQALRALNDTERQHKQVEEILGQRDIMQQLLLTLPMVQHIYPSDANFLLVRVDDACATYRNLQAEGIVVRNRHNVQLCDNCLRITIGTPEENAALYEALKAMC